MACRHRRRRGARAVDEGAALLDDRHVARAGGAHPAVEGALDGGAGVGAGGEGGGRAAVGALVAAVLVDAGPDQRVGVLGALLHKAVVGRADWRGWGW
jgi:hypothetical protein